MKKIFKPKILFLLGSLSLLIGFLLFLFYDAFFSGNFRTTQDKIRSFEHVNLTGLKELKASGGTSVNFGDLKRRLAHIKEDKIIVDGISEYHGYVKGIPTTFFAYQHRHPHWKYYIRRFVLTGTTEIRPDLVVSEEVEAKKQGFQYANIKIGSKFISSDQAIDEIVSLFENLPKDTWVHFHCHYGKGRTSMMLVMFDIMKNAPQVSLKDIVRRQHLLGSEDLLNTVVRKKGSYTQEQLDDRKEFITRFYEFVVQKKAGGIQQWSVWNQMTKATQAL